MPISSPKLEVAPFGGSFEHELQGFLAGLRIRARGLEQIDLLQFLWRPAQDSRPLLIGPLNFSGGIVERNHHRDAIEDRLQCLVPFQEDVAGPVGACDIVGHFQPGRFPSEVNPLEKDFHVNETSVFLPVRPYARRIRRFPGCLKALQETGNIVIEGDVLDGHRKKFLTRVTVVADRALADGQEMESLLVKDPSGLRVLFEQHLPFVLLCSAPSRGAFGSASTRAVENGGPESYPENQRAGKDVWCEGNFHWTTSF